MFDTLVLGGFQRTFCIVGRDEKYKKESPDGTRYRIINVIVLMLHGYAGYNCVQHMMALS